MRSSVTSIFTARRIASAVVLPGVFAGMLVFAAPASAQTAPTTGICNGVTNQLAHRGNVQPNLLKAAAKQNAEQIAKLQAERTALVTTQSNLGAQIKAAEAEIAALDAEYATLVGQIDTVTMSLTKLEADQATAILMRLTMLDVAAMQPGQGARSLIEHLGCLLICREAGRRFTLLGPRSSAGSLHHALTTAAASVAARDH